MTPGEIIVATGDIILNEGREAITLTVANTGDKRTNRQSLSFCRDQLALDFDRKAARGMRLDIAAGTAVRFEPGQTREVQLIAIAGARRVFGFNAEIMGDL